MFVAGEKAARGVTPYVLELDKEGAPVEVKIVRAGYVPQKRTVERTADAKLAVTLDKIKVVAPTNTTNTSEDTDEMMDPFHKKKAH